MAARKRSWGSELRRLALRMLKAKLRRRAKRLGLQRMRERSSPMVTSRLSCEVFSIVQWSRMAEAARTAGVAGVAREGAVSVERCQRPVLALRVRTSRSTRITAPTREDHSVSVKALAASKTMTLRSSCRLRPRLRLQVVESGEVLAQRSLAC